MFGFGKQNEEMFNHAENVGIKNESTETLFMEQVQDKYNKLAGKETQLREIMKDLVRRYDAAEKSSNIKEALGNTESAEYNLMRQRMVMLGGRIDDLFKEIDQINAELDNLFRFKEAQMNEPEIKTLDDLSQN